MTATHRWTSEDMPELTGKIAIVTGANSGLGLEVSRALARKGAHVVLACRNLEKAGAAKADLERALPAASLEVMALDLADLASIRRFALAFSQQHPGLHILCNNAGVMAIPYRQTVDGFEMQFGVNHLGHFALTGLLIETILKTSEARIVTVSSMLHRAGRIDFDNLNGQKSYDKRAAYNQSKLANLLFAYELQRKFDACRAGALSVAAHPGYAATNLQFAGPEMAGSGWQKRAMALSNRLFAQNAAMGAWPILYAAVAPNVRGGDYFGPGNFMGMRGYPARVRSSEMSYNAALAQRLWSVSEALTGVHYEVLVT